MSLSSSLHLLYPLTEITMMTKICNKINQIIFPNTLKDHLDCLCSFCSNWHNDDGKNKCHKIGLLIFQTHKNPFRLLFWQILTTAFTCVSMLLCLKFHAGHVDNSHLYINPWWSDASNKNPAGGLWLKWPTVYWANHQKRVSKSMAQQCFSRGSMKLLPLRQNREICSQLWKSELGRGPVCVYVRKEGCRCWHIVCVSGLEKLAWSLWKKDVAGCLVVVWQKHKS